MTANLTVKEWVQKCTSLCMPDRVVWVDGSEEQAKAIRQ